MNGVVGVMIGKVIEVIDRITWLQWMFIIFSILCLVLDKVILPYLKQYVDADYDSDNPYKKPKTNKNKYIGLMVLYISCEFIVRIMSVPVLPLAKEDIVVTEDEVVSETVLVEEEYSKVGNLILRCEYEVVPKEKWSELSAEELYLVRNGIYAYEGRIFIEKDLTDFFDQYWWYEPIILPKDFKGEYLNTYQHENIMNILEIEDKERGK